MIAALSVVVSVASAVAVAAATFAIDESNFSPLCVWARQDINLEEYLFENYFVVLLGTRGCFPCRCCDRFGWNPSIETLVIG